MKINVTIENPTIGLLEAISKAIQADPNTKQTVTVTAPAPASDIPQTPGPAPVENKAPAKATKASSASVTLEDIRVIVQQKAGDHKAEIKKLLEGYGVKNVSSMADQPENWNSLMDQLQAL